jgi:putative nucleotidyltransferase with HDIG domain
VFYNLETLPSLPFTPRETPARRVLSLSERLFGKRRDSGIVALLIALVEMGIAVVVFLTGGTQFVYLQFMYIPVGIAGLIFGSGGGLLFGLFAGAMLGPFMPLDVATGTAQPVLGWVIRLFFLSLQGLVAGFVGDLLKQRVRVVEVVAEELALTYGRILRALVGLIAERDDKTADHSERVAYNAIQMGRALGFHGMDLETLYWAAVLHDLGKVGIPESILNKPGPLTPEERAVMERHVDIGYRMLVNASTEFTPIAEVVAAHHERWDGQGYPNHVANSSIPLAGRVLSVLDVFEALTSKRPYRDPMPPFEALALIEDEAGGRFDPQVVQVFVQLFHEQKLAFSDDDDTKLEHLHERYGSSALLLGRLRGAHV